MSILLTAHVQAGDSDDIFNDWQGQFISRQFVNKKPEMDTLYNKVVIEAKKRGKDYTKAMVRDSFEKIVHTDFHQISLKGDSISFYDEKGSMEKYRYKALGIVPDKYGDNEIEWYGFEAMDKESKFSEYRYIIMGKIHTHKNGQSHFHMRYGQQGIDTLTVLGGIKNWWPTIVRPDFDVDAYLKHINPKFMAKLLP